MRLPYPLLFLAALAASTEVVAPGTESLAPTSRTIHPVSIYKKTGNVSSTGKGAGAVFHLAGPNAAVTYDFGRMVAGIPTISFSNAACYGKTCSTYSLPSFSCGLLCQGLGLAYTENVQFVSQESDNSVLYTHNDGTLFLPLNGGKNYTVPAEWGRGSFRYLTLSLGKATDQNTRVSVHFDSLHYTASPDVLDETKLGDYSGYFSSSDALLNRIWQAGAYTLQLCAVSANSSIDHTYIIRTGWSNSATAKGLSGSDVYLSDGAKRDRNPWAGDVGVSLRSALVSRNFNNLRALRNTLQEIIILQDTTLLSSTRGFFPYAGSPLGDLLVSFGSVIGIPAYGSDTYHLWAIIGFAEYLKVSGDVAWAKQYWPQIVTGVTTTYRFINTTTGLYSGVGTLDWGRTGIGGQNTALNALYFHCLSLMSNIAPSLPAVSGVDVAKWTAMAAKVKSSANTYLYDTSVGLYKDNTTVAGSKVHPQDGNTFAIFFNLTKSAAQKTKIASGLSLRHGRTGASAPELPGSVSPFISSLELGAQFLAHPGNASVPMSLMRTMWGFMMQEFSNSTFVEGYSAAGTLAYGFYPNGENFTSHAHGWSTGPVYSLLHDVVGLQTTSLEIKPTDGQWRFRPAIAGSALQHAKGGYTTVDGSFAAQWQIMNNKEVVANFTVPSKLSGTIYAPIFGLSATDVGVYVDGKKVTNVNCGGAYARIGNVKGGKHTVRVVASHAFEH